MALQFTTATAATSISFKQNKFLWVLALLFAASWFYMQANCINLQDWYIENLLVFIFIAAAVVGYKKYVFSNLSFLFIFLFLWLHIYGAMYAYTQNPVGEFFQNKYHLWRNPYDRVVHFSFGFLLAYPLHEYLRNKLQVKSRWQYILTCEIILSLACTFELIEWTVAELTTKETGETYVATQGDVWDAHKDIVLALAGAAITMTALYFYRKKPALSKKQKSLPP